MRTDIVTQAAGNMTRDIVFIEDLRIETIIGIYDWERKIKQTIALDIDMQADNRRPAASENIDDALNYKAVAKRLIAFTEDSSFQLVETLAERLAAAGFKPRYYTPEIHKASFALPRYLLDALEEADQGA